MRELKRFATQVVASLSAWPVNLDSVLQEMEDYATRVESRDKVSDLKASQCIGRCIFWMYQTVVNDIMRLNHMHDAEDADFKGPSKGLAQMIMLHLNEQFPQDSDEEEDEEEDEEGGEEEEEEEEGDDKDEEEEDEDDDHCKDVEGNLQTQECVEVTNEIVPIKEDEAGENCMMERQKTMHGDIRKRGRSF